MKIKKFIYKSVNSTNDIAIKIINKKNIKVGFVVAAKQKKGRGQRGKRWISYKGNLFVSVFFSLEKINLSLKQLTRANVQLIMNLGVFCCLFMMKRNNQFFDKLEDLSGLSKNHPIISLSLLVLLFSLAGIPPMAGFFAKFYIFISVIEESMYFLAIVGLISTVVSAFYYLRIIKIIYFDPPKEKFDQVDYLGLKVSLAISTLLILLYFIYPSALINLVSKINII